MCNYNILLLWPNSVNTISEFLRLVVEGFRRLHPNHVAVWCIGNGAIDSSLAAALVPVVTLTCSRSVPVEEHIDTCKTLGDCTSLLVALALALLVELSNQFLFVDMDTSVDSVCYSLMKELQVGFLGPSILNRLKFYAVLSSLLGSVHEVAQRLNRGVCYT